MLFVAHDLRLVRHISHRVAVMYLGKVVELADRGAVFTTSQHPYTRALLAAAPELDPAKRSRKIAAKGELPSPIHPQRASCSTPAAPMRSSVALPSVRN